MNDVTIKMNVDDHTQPQKSFQKYRLRLKEDAIFEGKNDSYRIIASAENNIGSGGDSLIYIATRVSDDEQVVAKIYDQFADTPENRYNRNRVVGFLSENNNYKETHIMPLIDCGFISLNGNDGDSYVKPIDIIPYCEEGALKKKIDYDTLRNEVICGTLKALAALHSGGIVHRDIKPSNLFLYNGIVVLGDFGISGEVDESCIYATQGRRGTLGYRAPQINRGYVSIASDYYSFGCTIATLYNGEHVHQIYIDEDNEAKLNHAMDTKGLPLDCPDSEKDLQVLVDALTVADSEFRAGYNDVQLWLEDSGAFTKQWANRAGRSKDDEMLGWRDGDVVYDTIPELTQAFLENPDKAKRYLYRGIIDGFFKQIDPTLADIAISIQETKETAQNQDLGLAQFMHHLNTARANKTCPIYWCGKSYNNPDEIATAIAEGVVTPEIVIAMLKSKLLSWKYIQENCDDDLINSLLEIENITASYEKLGFQTFILRLSDDMTNGYKSPDEMFAKLSKDNWCDDAQNMLNNEEDLAALINIGYKDAVLQLKKQLTGIFASADSTCDLTHIYNMFETICKDKIAVRIHYIQKGPLSYLYWWQQNLEKLYSFSDFNKAQTLKGHIQSIKIDASMTVRELHDKKFSALREHLKDFMSLLNNDIRSVHLGIHLGKDRTGVIPIHRDAFFTESFFGIAVPVGYCRYVEQALNAKA